MSREETCAVALIGHLNRVPSTDAYLRIANSTAFWNACRSVVLITEDEGDDMRLVAQRKANLARLAPVERHVLEEVTLDLADPETGQSIVSSKMRFVEIADDVNPDEILTGPHKATRTETAEGLLAAVLADEEWHESGGVKKLMEAAGHSERTVQRASNDLGVEVERRGFPSVTYWRVASTSGSPRAPGDLPGHDPGTPRPSPTPFRCSRTSGTVTTSMPQIECAGRRKTVRCCCADGGAGDSGRCSRCYGSRQEAAL